MADNDRLIWRVRKACRQAGQASDNDSPFVFLQVLKDEGFSVVPTQEEVMTVDEALDIVARAVISHYAAEPEWEQWPEIRESDWESVCARVKALTPFPKGYATAYELLEARAVSAAEGGDNGT